MDNVYTCCVCKRQANVPLFSACCAEAYCWDCVSGKQPTCQQCGKVLREHEFNVADNRAIPRRSSAYISGSPRVSPRGSPAPVRALRSACPFNCGRLLTSAEMEQHMRECDNAAVTCPACRAIITKGAYAAHCEQSCPAADTMCEFASYGCTARVPRFWYEHHLTEKEDYHLKLISAGIRRSSSPLYPPMPQPSSSSYFPRDPYSPVPPTSSSFPQPTPVPPAHAAGLASSSLATPTAPPPFQISGVTDFINNSYTFVSSSVSSVSSAGRALAANPDVRSNLQNGFHSLVSFFSSIVSSHPPNSQQQVAPPSSSVYPGNAVVPATARPHTPAVRFLLFCLLLYFLKGPFFFFLRLLILAYVCVACWVFADDRLHIAALEPATSRAAAIAAYGSLVLYLFFNIL